MTKKKELIFSFSICLLLLWNVIYRLLVFLQFSTDFTDSDQVIMWSGVRDFSLGQFHEPAYYGQAYNSMVEALFASVFLNSISPSRILPLITSILAIAPYFIVAAICFIRKLKLQALIILTLPLVLPPEYDFITSMPRGFVTGIFFTTIAASLAMYCPEKKWSFFSFSFFSVIGITLNPNAVLMVIPCGLFLLSVQYKNKRFYKQFLAGGLIASILPLYTWYFYKQHPLYIVHGLGDLEFTMDNFLLGFSMLYKIVQYITPFIWYQPLLFFLMLLTPTVIFFLQKEKMKGLIFGTWTLIILATLSVNKIYDGDGTLFLPYSRMYLAVPVTIVLFIPFIKIDNWKPVLISIVTLASVFFLYKVNVLDETISDVTIEARHGILTVGKVTDIKDNCGRLNGLCKQYGVELVLIADYNDGDSFIDYGCPACEKELPPTLSPKNERRTWRLIEEKEKVNKTILIIDDTQKIKAAAQSAGFPETDFLKLENDKFLLRNNSLPTMELIQRLNIKVRPF